MLSLDRTASSSSRRWLWYVPVADPLRSSADIQIVGTVSTCLAGVAMFLALIVLGLSAWIYSVPSARSALDRISFRLMLYTMVVEVGFGIVFVLNLPGVRS